MFFRTRNSRRSRRQAATISAEVLEQRRLLSAASFPSIDAGDATPTEGKESGEKGGTTDINIGLGELDECTSSAAVEPGGMEWDNVRNVPWPSSDGGMTQIDPPSLTLQSGSDDAVSKCGQAGREDLMEIYGFSHEVVSPRDAASGLPTGKRQHKPIVVSGGEAGWETAGKEFQYYSVELDSANVGGIRQEMLNNKYPENMKHEIREHVAMTYQNVFEDGGITAEDDWETPVV